MGVNADKPHLFVLPEDDANRQIANGFHKELYHIRQMQVLRTANGWKKVLEAFQANHVKAMASNSKMFMVLLIDFDDRGEDRWRVVETYIGNLPEELKNRVFVIGPKNEPEDLKKAKLGSLEKIGTDLAKDCRDGTDLVWSHELLQHPHNEKELMRLREYVRPILFQPQEGQL